MLTLSGDTPARSPAPALLRHAVFADRCRRSTAELTSCSASRGTVTPNLRSSSTRAETYASASGSDVGLIDTPMGSNISSNMPSRPESKPHDDTSPDDT